MREKRPNDNPEVVARRLLREKHGEHSSFYSPIRYPRSYGPGPTGTGRGVIVISP